MQSPLVDALVANLANVNGIGKQFVERSPEKQVPTRSFTVPCNSHLRADATTIQILHQESDGTEVQISIEYPSHRFRFRLIHDQAAIDHVVTDRHQTAHPHALLLGGGDLVANA